MKKTYVITVESKGKSTVFLETLEAQIPLLLEMLSNHNHKAYMHMVDCPPEELLEILKEKQINVIGHMLPGGPLTFEPTNAKGEPLPL